MKSFSFLILTSMVPFNGELIGNMILHLYTGVNASASFISSTSHIAVRRVKVSLGNFAQYLKGRGEYIRLCKKHERPHEKLINYISHGNKWEKSKQWTFKTKDVHDKIAVCKLYHCIIKYNLSS